MTEIKADEVESHGDTPGLTAHGTSLVAGTVIARAERAVAGEDDVSLVRALGAGMSPATVGRRLEEVCAGVDTRRVYIVVFSEVAHVGWRETGGFSWEATVGRSC